MTGILKISGLDKRFTLHTQDGAEIDVFRDAGLVLNTGQALAVTGASGMGKSTFLKMVYGTYKADAGEILIRHDDQWIDMAKAPPRHVIAIREKTIGYVSQFLRVIPRIPALDIVAEPMLDRGMDEDVARIRAGELLARLNIPEHLWRLSPLTFSGGEQQRVNIARGFAAPSPLMLLDEPTASLDRKNRETVWAMIKEARDAGSAILGVYHNEEDRNAVCTGTFDLTEFRGAA